MRTLHVRKSTNHHNPRPTATPSKRAANHQKFTDRIRRLLDTRQVVIDVLGIRDELAVGLWDDLWNKKKLVRLRWSVEREAYEEAIHGEPSWVGPDRARTMERLFAIAGLYFPAAPEAKQILMDTLGARPPERERHTTVTRLLDAAKDILDRRVAPTLTIVGGAQ